MRQSLNNGKGGNACSMSGVLVFAAFVQWHSHFTQVHTHTHIVLQTKGGGFIHLGIFFCRRSICTLSSIALPYAHTCTLIALVSVLL